MRFSLSNYFSKECSLCKLFNGTDVGNHLAMLTEIYIEALLVDEERADEVWEIWDAGKLNDVAAYIAWMLIIRQTLSD